MTIRATLPSMGHVLRIVAAAAFIFLHCGQLRAEQVDSLLVTALDVSSSINAQETMLQVEGLADAIRSQAVVSAIENGKLGRIGFTVFVWADGDYPELVAWRTIASQADADDTASEILATLEALIASSSRSVGTLTNLSGAMDHAGTVLAASPYTARRALVNIVGNGEDNVGEDPQRARADLLAAGVTINGVVVGGDKAVMAYYRANVIGGRFAFVLPAGSAADMTQAMIAKFVTEIAQR